jgi:hypothetical protein
MNKRIFLPVLIFILLIPSFLFSQNSSFIILGDIHYDRLEDHDMEWLGSKPDDLRQVTKEYTVFTEKYWDDFISVLKQKVDNTRPAVKAIIQAGDLSEGLAGSPEKASQMASNVIRSIDESHLNVPWILAKGNHDVTGPGSKEAFTEFYTPFIRKQTGNPGIVNASYSYKYDNVLITCLDPWDNDMDMIDFLDKELSSSKAKFKFVVVHEPVIPVTERCWHLLRRDLERREKLLEVIAKNKAIVICAHLHRYSIVARQTNYGPIIQVMVVSVIKDREYLIPSKMITEYGPSLASDLPGWEPATLESRKKMLSDEARYVTFYKQTDLPGYAVIRLNDKKGTVLLDYYAAFGKKPYDTVNLTELFKTNL